jgi:opacity protein-like surface antigen
MQAPESTPRQPSDVDYPPESVTPDDVPSNDNSQPQQQSVDALDYEQGRPFQESINRSNVYRAPPVDAMPPIVQPNQAPAYNLQPQMQQRMTQPRMAPTYQSPYQPIPGLAPSQPLYQQPGYQQPAYQPPAYQQQVPSQPMYSQQAPSAFAQNNVAGDPSVYSPVVGQCGSCNSCNNGCKSCGEGCPNFYVSLFAGISDLRDLESQAGFGSINADSGEAFGIALGRRNGRNLRTEAEFTYRQNDIDGMLPTLQPFSGSLNSYSGMANAYWEFIDVPTGCFKPYIGVGIGFVGVDVEATDQLGRNLIPSSTDNDTSFAFQYMAGVNYKAYRNVDLFAEYRFFEADSFRINAPGLADSFNYETDNVLFGFRWKF